MKISNKRSAKNIANSLFGYGTGLTTLQGSGRYADAEPTFFYSWSTKFIYQ